MGWKTDWLYHLVFGKFEHAWARAQREGEGSNGPASVRLVVSQFNKGRETRTPRCKGLPSRAWYYTGTVWEEAEAALERTTEDNAVGGMFYQTACGGFHISKDRKTVIIEYTFGPRYGRGFVFLVKGQGRMAELRPKPNSISWCS